nr:ribonuclease H-like domain-containing protein [Tanacetum cinerariifolium]
MPGPVTNDEKAQKKNDVKARTFVSSPSCNSNNEVPTDFRVSTASPYVSTANLSDATVYAFLANQPNGSQLVHEDLEQIHEDDLEEMDIKWQLALLSTRSKRFFQKTGKKITINGSDTGNYDKAKVECFNYHKMGYFARECRVPRNQENRTRNQDTTRRTVNMEDTSSKAIVAIDGAGLDWSYMADDEAPINKAFMAFQTQSKEKDDLDNKNEKFENASQGLDKLIGSQIIDKSKRGLGYVSYNAVLPPHNRRFSLPRIDFSHTGLLKFVKPGVKSCGVKPIEESEGEDKVESPPKIEREGVEPSIDKVEVDIPKQNDKPARRSVKYDEMYRTQRPKGNISYLTDFKEFYGGFTWVFFLATKDETSRIRKSFITEIENLVGTNSNDFEGKRASFDAGQSSMETGPIKDYILMPLWNDGSLFDSSSKYSDGDNKDNDGPCKESKIDNQERPNVENSTKDVNTAGPSINTASLNSNTASLTVNTVRQSDDFFGADNDIKSLDGVEIDISNISTTYPIHTTPNTRIHKDNSLDNMIGDIQFGVQTRRMIVTTDEQGFISDIYEKTHEYLHTCLFARFLSQKEPKRITNALKDPALMDVKSAFMYGRIEKEVYACQPLGFEDPNYPDKVYKVEKALYGLHQAPRAWYEILAKYLLDNGFHKGKIDQTLFIKRQKEDILLVQVYADDIIFGFTKKELWFQVKQKSDGIFISKDKYIDEIFRMFKYTDVKPASTPMDKEKDLLKDSNGDDVDVHLYSPNSTNEVPTTYGVSTASTQSSTASTQVSIANLSDATVQPRNQDSRSWNQDSSRRTVNVEETPPKAMVAIDVVGFDWSYMAEDEVPTNMALIAFSDSEIDLSYSGHEEFQQPEFQSYGPKSCKTESKNSSKEIPNELKESPDAPLVKDRVSDNKDWSQGPRGNQRNWNNLKSQQLGSNFVMYNKACFVCGSFEHVQANYNYHHRERVISKNSIEDMLPFGEEQIVAELLVNELLKLATLDESILWHRRLGYIKFKNINKLVKDNLVRGLPTKRFENDQTCAACLKGKQHKASYYDEVFAPVARIKAIRLFLAYASFMGFMVYQMDVKSTFLYEKIEKEVYVCQPLGYEDSDHPDKVYKVVKVIYDLHQAPRAWGDFKTITTRSGIFYDGPHIPPPTSSLPKVVKRVPEVTKDTVQPSTENIQPPVAQTQVPIDEPVVASKPKPTIPYPLRANKQKLYGKDDNLALKFVDIFRNLHVNFSFADILLHMPKFALMFKSLLNNKEKLFNLATTLKKLSLPELTPTRMILELADRSTTRPAGNAKDVFVKVGKFHFPTDFVVVDYVVDPRVPLILEILFLRTKRALIDVYGEELTHRVDDEAITFKVGQTLKYSYGDAESVNQIDVIDVACEEYVHEVLEFLEIPKRSNFILDEIETIVRSLDELSNLDDDYYDTKGDILYLEKLLIEDPSSNLPSVKTEDLKQVDATMTKPSIEEP